MASSLQSLCETLTPRQDFEELYAAGLTPFDVLQAATYNPAVFLGTTATSGTVSPGKVADLVLLNANPFDDVQNAFRQDGVMPIMRKLAMAEA